MSVIKTTTGIGDRFHTVREDQGLSIDQIAQRSGKNPQFLKDIENDRADPTVRDIVDIAHAMSVSPKDLMRDVN